MVEAKACKKLQGIKHQDIWRLCETLRKAVQYLLTGCNKLAGKECIRQHRNALMVLAVQWSVQEGILPKETKWFKERWEKQKITENNEEEIYSDREHQMRANCTSIRPGLALEDKEKKIKYLVYMSCPIELSKATKGDEKIQKYQQLVFDIREQWQGFKVKIILIMIGFLLRGRDAEANQWFKWTI